MLGLLAMLKAIPARAWVALAACVALVALAAAGLRHAEATGDAAGYSRGMAVAAKIQATLDAERLDWAGERQAAAEGARLAERAARTEEQRRAAALQEALDAAELVAQRERADRAIADAAAGRLRERVQALVAAARYASRNPSPTLGGAPASDPVGVLADVLGRCETRVRFLAGVADERGRAGELCVRAYDALTAPATESATAPEAAASSP